MKKYWIHEEKERKNFKAGCYIFLFLFSLCLACLMVYTYYEYNYDIINYTSVMFFAFMIVFVIIVPFSCLMWTRKIEVFKYVLFDNEYVSKYDGKGKLIFKYNISDVTAVQRVIVDGNEVVARGAWNYVYNDYICVIFNDNVLFPRRVGHLGFNTLGRPNKVYTERELKIAQHETYNRRNVELPPLKHPLSSYGKEITAHVDNFVFFTYTDDIWQEMIEMFGDKVIE